MSKRVLWALAAVGVIATLPLAVSSCKKDEPDPNTANNFSGEGQYGSGQQPGYNQPGAQPGYGQPSAQPGYGQPGTQPGYTQPGTQPTTTAPPAGTGTGGQPAGNDPFGQLTGMVGAVLGQMGGAATGGTASGGGADPISLGIQHNASQNAPGMQPIGSMVRLTLQQGQTSEGQFQLQPGKCYTLVAASMPGVIETEIKVTMPAPLTTQVLGQNAAGPNPMPVVWGGEQCYTTPSPIAMPVRLEVTMKQGAGTIGIQPYAK
ncbi:MAG: hypothetical protein ACOC1F_01795 [Myxococcota bacterium]